jgi:hypothetical protein
VIDMKPEHVIARRTASAHAVAEAAAALTEAAGTTDDTVWDIAASHLFEAAIAALVNDGPAAFAALCVCRILLERYAPSCPDAVDAARRVGLMLARVQRRRVRTCRSCGCRFSISAPEADAFARRRLTLPTHCCACRRVRRQARVQREANRVATR